MAVEQYSMVSELDSPSYRHGFRDGLPAGMPTVTQRCTSGSAFLCGQRASPIGDWLLPSAFLRDRPNVRSVFRCPTTVTNICLQMSSVRLSDPNPRTCIIWMTKLFIACSSLSSCWRCGQGPRDDVIRRSTADHCDRHHVNLGCHHHKLICEGSGQSWSQMPFSRAARLPQSPEIQQDSGRASIRCPRRSWRPTKPVPGHNGKRARFAVISLRLVLRGGYRTWSRTPNR